MVPCRMGGGQRRGYVDDHQGKLPLQGDDIRGFRGTADGDAVHLFVLLETRLALGLLHPIAVQAHHATEKRCLLYWSTGEPDFDNPKISINSRLFDDFDLDKVEVVVIDGKNLW